MVAEVDGSTQQEAQSHAAEQLADHADDPVLVADQVGGLTQHLLEGQLLFLLLDRNGRNLDRLVKLGCVALCGDRAAHLSD